METGKENYKEQDTGFELTMFTIEDEDSFNPGENFKEEEEKEKLTSKEKEEDDFAKVKTFVNSIVRYHEEDFCYDCQNKSDKTDQKRGSFGSLFFCPYSTSCIHSA